MNVIEITNHVSALLKCWKKEIENIEISDVDQVVIFKSAASIIDERVMAASRMVVFTESLNSIRRK